jgi:hypothetical protein
MNYFIFNKKLSQSLFCEQIKIRRRDLLAQDLLMIEEAERRRREKRIDEKIEVTKCNLYSDFQHKMQKKLENLHKQVQKTSIFSFICYFYILYSASKSRKKQNCARYDHAGRKE